MARKLRRQHWGRRVFEQKLRGPDIHGKRSASPRHALYPQAPAPALTSATTRGSCAFSAPRMCPPSNSNG